GSAAAPDTTTSTALTINAAAAPNALVITGNAGTNALTGTAFTDTLDGGDGLDSMDGGQSGDLYLMLDAAHHSAAEISDTGTTG
ncbi:MAG: hypothetical protein ACK486_14440, partial [Cyanobacteriota bacterium]